MTRRVIDTRGKAVGLFETFMDRPSKRSKTMEWTWPDKVQEVGAAEAEMYRSNKWKKDKSDWEKYKHIAEAPQTCYVIPGVLVRDDDPRSPLPVYGPMHTLPRVMPRHFAELAPCEGVQVQLYGRGGPGTKGGLYEVRFAHSFWGAAEMPDGEQFLFVYHPQEGVKLIVTGEKLSITKDGIVG